MSDSRTLYLKLCLPHGQSYSLMKEYSLKGSGSKLIIFGALVRRIPEASVITGALQGFCTTANKAAGSSLTCSWDVTLISARVSDCPLSRLDFPLTAQGSQEDWEGPSQLGPSVGLSFSFQLNSCLSKMLSYIILKHPHIMKIASLPFLPMAASLNTWN